MKAWIHSHEFESQARGGAEGTVVRDAVEYELPFGVLGTAGRLDPRREDDAGDVPVQGALAELLKK